MKKLLIILFFISCKSAKTSVQYLVRVVDSKGNMIMGTDNEDSGYIIADNYWFKNFQTCYVIENSDTLYSCGFFNLFNPNLDKIDSSTIQ